MARTDGSVAPKERINIKYVPATGDQQAEVELPHKMLVTGDFGLRDDRPLEERQPMRIDKHSFNSVLADADVNLHISVPNALAAEPGSELAVQLQFSSINDFSPDAVATQVPELHKLLQLREALVALKGPLGNVMRFRKQLQAMLDDDNTRAQLAIELDLVLEPPKP